MKKILTITLLLLLAITASACKDDSGVTTVSIGQIYEDTNKAHQSVSIYTLAFDDIETSGDMPYISIERPGFRFECQGLDTDKTLWIFIDGDIDDVAGEFKVEDNTMNDEIILEDGSPREEGTHIVQFVQFDGNEPSFCITKHYSINYKE